MDRRHSLILNPLALRALDLPTCFAAPAAPGIPCQGVHAPFGLQEGRVSTYRGTRLGGPSIPPLSVLLHAACSTSAMVQASRTAWKKTDALPTSGVRGRSGLDAVARMVLCCLKLDDLTDNESKML